MHTIHIDGLERSLRIVRFSGHEELSRLFEVEIVVTCEERDVAPSGVVGRPALLTIQQGGASRFVHGMVSRFSLAGSGKSRAEYRVTLVPSVWRMRLRTDSRIYQGLTVPEIIADVMARAGVLRTEVRGRERRERASASGYQMDLGQAHRARENCVQYRESDWDFLSRLLEEEGMHCFFEHDEASHVLVISDSPSHHEPMEGGDSLSFRPAAAGAAAEHVARFQFGEEVRPSRVVLSDYAFERPMLPLTASAQADGDSAFEVYEHPGEYDVPAAGQAISQIRLEELQAARWTGEGDGSSARMVPGRTFWLADHPVAELNRGYLITRIDYQGAEAQSDGGETEERFLCRFHVIPSNVPFRPARTTPRPIIPGIQTAIVVGLPGEEIHTDEHGRIKVRFHWDRSGRSDDRCSCWIRVAQASAGAAFGSVFLPRVGQEVVVDFLEGDPDRPIVTGSVYHGANVPPYTLPAEKTKSTIKTSSSPGGGGSNELRFEDRKGAEEVYLHAQRELNIKVEDDKSQRVGGDETLTVHGNRTVQVNECHTETVLLAQTITVGAALTQTVGAVMTTAVAGAKFETVGVNSSEMVVFRKSVKAGTDHRVSAGRNATTKAVRDVSIHAGNNVSTSSGLDTSLFSGRNLSATATSKISMNAGKGMTVSVTGNHHDSASHERTIVAGESLSIRCGGSSITISKEGKIVITGHDITIESPDKPVKIHGKNIHVKSDGAVNVVASGKVQVKGKAVGLN